MASIKGVKDQRYAWLDACKGIGIILVVLGHAIIAPIRAENAVAMFIYQIIYYFHMPFMMFLSGLAYRYFNRVSSKKESLFKKVKRVLIPYVTYTILVELFVFIALKVPGISPLFVSRGYVVESLTTFLMNMVIGSNTYTTHLWYIYTLFVFYAGVILTENIVDKRLHLIIGIILFAIKCIFNTDGLYLINDICTLYIWFAIGMNTDVYGDIYGRLNCSKVRWFTIVCGLGYFIADILYIPTPSNPLLYTVHTIIKFSFIYVFIVSVICECMNAKNHNSILPVLGEKSFTIYIFHQPFACVGVVTLLYGKIADIFAIFIGVLLSFSVAFLMDRLLEIKYLKYVKKLLKG